MTVSAPPEPMLPPRRRPWGILVLVAVVLVVIGYLAFSSVGSALVYYRTPTELLARGEAAVGETVRLGGLVEAGSVSGPATDLTFVVTDGESRIEVHSTVAPTRSFREGSGAVVEGSLRDDGVFEATQVIVKHDENYEVPASGTQPSDHSFDPGRSSDRARGPRCVEGISHGQPAAALNSAMPRGVAQCEPVGRVVFAAGDSAQIAGIAPEAGGSTLR